MHVQEKAATNRMKLSVLSIKLYTESSCWPVSHKRVQSVFNDRLYSFLSVCFLVGGGGGGVLTVSATSNIKRRCQIAAASFTMRTLTIARALVDHLQQTNLPYLPSYQNQVTKVIYGDELKSCCRVLSISVLS